MSPRTPEQFQELRSESRAKILDAALHVFAEEGYHSSSVSKVALRAGVSKGLMYNYFTSKEELLRTLVLDLFEEAILLLGVKEGEVIDDQRFKDIVGRSVDVPLQQPQRWKLYMSLAFQGNVAELMMREMAPRMAPYLESMSLYFKSKGYKDAFTEMRIFSAMLDGIQMHCLLDPKNFPAEKAKELLINQFVK